MKPPVMGELVSSVIKYYSFVFSVSINSYYNSIFSSLKFVDYA